MAEYKLIIPYTLPGLNEYTAANRYHRQAGGKMKSRIEDGLAQLIKNQLKGVHITVPVTMVYLWVEKDKRRDKDNIAFAKKFVQDALVKAGVLKNDGWKEIERFEDRFDVDKRCPRVEVTITELGSY